MLCQSCGSKNAHFTGSSSSCGPAESDVENIAANLPGGFSWLCDDCLGAVAYMENLNEALANGEINYDTYQYQIECLRGEHPQAGALAGGSRIAFAFWVPDDRRSC